MSYKGPTKRMRIAFDKTMETNGAIAPAMIAAGYGPGYAKNSHLITRTNGWKQLVEEHLSDEKLAKKHSQLLEDKNHNIQLGALSLGYKLKGYEKTTPPSGTYNQFNFGTMTNEQLDHILSRMGNQSSAEGENEASLQD